jgi:hypothetical protein
MNWFEEILGLKPILNQTSRHGKFLYYYLKLKGHASMPCLCSSIINKVAVDLVLDRRTTIFVESPRVLVQSEMAAHDECDTMLVNPATI